MLTKSTQIICSICHSAIESAMSCSGCGHTLCKLCLESTFAVKVDCPTCRKEIKCTAPICLAQSIIDHIFKPNTTSQVVSCDSEKDQAKRRKLGPKTFAATDSKTYSEIETSRKGKNYQVKKSLEEQHCFEQIIDTQKPYTSEEFSRAILKMERRLELQFRLREAKIREQCEYKLKEMEMTMEKERIHRKLINSCRTWIHFKSDLMLDFVVYLVFQNNNEKEKKKSKFVSCLLCGIPGPKKTPWEGSLVPLKIKYSNDQSFSAEFPKDLCKFIENPFGTTCLTCIQIPKVYNTLTKILFTFQQALAYSCKPDQTGKRCSLYYNQIKRLSKDYPPEHLAKKAVECEMIQRNETVLSNDVISISAKIAQI